MMQRRLTKGVACILAPLLLGFWHCASAQSDLGKTGQESCLEIIAGRAGIPPGAPMLFDKCTGHTFMLIKTRGQGFRGGKPARYVWERIPMREPLSALASTRRAPTSKCFAYDNRLFCE